MAQPVRLGVGVIGCGYWGAHYLRLFEAFEDTCVVRMCDIDRGRLRGEGATTDWRDVLADDAVRAVVIATPASLHAEMAAGALRAGRHVLVEKPMATCLRDAEEVAALATDLVLVVGHTYLFNDGIRRMRERLSAIGSPVRLRARRTHQGPVRSDVNVVWDLASHDVAIFNHLLGTLPTHASARGTRDAVSITLLYPNEVRAELEVSWEDPRRVREVVVEGTLGACTFLESDGRVRLDGPEGAASFTTEPLRAQCRHFVDCIGGRARVQSGGAEGVAVVRVLEAIDRAMHEGRRVDV